MPVTADPLNLLGLALGIAALILAVLGVALALWIHQKTNEVNASIMRTQQEIADTAGVLKSLVDGLLGTTWAHVARQNEAMTGKLLALQATVQKESTDAKPVKGEDLEASLTALRSLVVMLTQAYLDDIRKRSTPAWIGGAPPLTLMAPAPSANDVI